MVKLWIDSPGIVIPVLSESYESVLCRSQSFLSRLNINTNTDAKASARAE